MFMFSDAFQVSLLPSSEHFFSEYSASLSNFDENGVYEYTHKTSFGSYAFIGIDLSPDPGPGRPFNFFSVPRKVSLSEENNLCNKNFLQI